LPLLARLLAAGSSLSAMAIPSLGSPSLDVQNFGLKRRRQPKKAWQKIKIKEAPQRNQKEQKRERKRERDKTRRKEPFFLLFLFLFFSLA